MWLIWLRDSFVLCVGFTSLPFFYDEYCSLLSLGLDLLLTCGVFHCVKHRVHFEMELRGYSASLDVEYQRDIS